MKKGRGRNAKKRKKANAGEEGGGYEVGIVSQLLEERVCQKNLLSVRSSRVDMCYLILTTEVKKTANNKDGLDIKPSEGDAW